MEKEIVEAKNNYINKLMYDNERVAREKGLTDEQVTGIEEICAIRHKVHSNIDAYFNSESGLNFDFVDEIKKIIEETQLPPIHFTVDVVLIPTDIDYYEFLTSSERQEWEDKSEEYNRNKPDFAMAHTGFTLWKEESGEYEDFYKQMEQINTTIEDWLYELDKTYGTSYRPTGIARMR